MRVKVLLVLPSYSGGALPQIGIYNIPSVEPVCAFAFAPLCLEW